MLLFSVAQLGVKEVCGGGGEGYGNKRGMYTKKVHEACRNPDLLVFINFFIR